MKLVGVNELKSPASSTASEDVKNVEVSLLLEIAASWYKPAGTQIAEVKSAANLFIDEVLSEFNRDTTSVSIIPFAAGVSAGPDIFNAMNMVRDPGNPGWCVEFDSSDYLTSTLRMDGTYEHRQFVDMSNWRNSHPYDDPIVASGCPGRDDGNFDPLNRDYEQIQPFSQDPVSLKNQINQLQERGTTEIHTALKWGIAMLDPSFQPVVQKLSAQNKIDGVFKTRPASYSDPNTNKHLVLVSAGDTNAGERAPDWAYLTYSQRVHWTKYPVPWFARSYATSSQKRWYYRHWRPAKYDFWSKFTLYNNICKTARDNGIVVWTVSFAVYSYYDGVLRSCAASPSHHFKVNSENIDKAFQSIGHQITLLRLTQ